MTLAFLGLVRHTGIRAMKNRTGHVYPVAVHAIHESTRLGWAWRVRLFSTMFMVCRLWPFNWFGRKGLL